MTNLTEQWKKGKLEFGKKYYVRFEDGEIDTAQWCYYTNQDRYGFDVDEVEEVLAPVPSYEEWQRILHYAGKYEYEYTSCVMDYENLKEENQQLKELLKECMNMFVKMYETNMVNSVFLGLYENIKTKIDNEIGEKK